MTQPSYVKAIRQIIRDIIALIVMTAVIMGIVAYVRAAHAAAVIYVPHPGCQDHPMFYFQGTAFDCAAK